MTRTYQFTALTNIWTGTARVEEKPNRRTGQRELVDTIVSGRLIATGLLGSIRWWFEVVVRGFDGKPCDPSRTECTEKKRCVVCELFGCTGWARKFRFDVLDANDAIQIDQIEKDTTFKLRFTPLRGIAPEEWTLLELALRLIANYGAIAGKTVFKPTHEDARQGEIHHRDFGLIQVSTHQPREMSSETDLESYATASRWRGAPQDGFSWASLEHFWCVRNHDECLARQDAHRSTFNRVIRRNESKSQAGSPDSWLAGYRAQSEKNGKPAVKAQSKKVFSFKSPARTFGFTNPARGNDHVSLDEIKKRLGAAWQRQIVEREVAAGDQTSIQLLTGRQIRQRLLQALEVKR